MVALVSLVLILESSEPFAAALHGMPTVPNLWSMEKSALLYTHHLEFQNPS